MEDKNMTNTNKFLGVEISKYGMENGKVDRATLFQAIGGGILNNEIFNETVSQDMVWKITNGTPFMSYDSDGKEYTYEEAMNRIEELQDMISTNECLLTPTFEDEEIEDRDELEAEISKWTTDIENLNTFYENTVYQYYIITPEAATILSKYTNELVFFCAEINTYLWGVTSYGTNWNYELTDITLDSLR